MRSYVSPLVLASLVASLAALGCAQPGGGTGTAGTSGGGNTSGAGTAGTTGGGNATGSGTAGTTGGGNTTGSGTAGTTGNSTGTAGTTGTGTAGTGGPACVADTANLVNSNGWICDICFETRASA